jgi:hypothetical protein
MQLACLESMPSGHYDACVQMQTHSAPGGQMPCNSQPTARAVHDTAKLLASSTGHPHIPPYINAAVQLQQECLIVNSRGVPHERPQARMRRPSNFAASSMRKERKKDGSNPIRAPALAPSEQYLASIGGVTEPTMLQTDGCCRWACRAHASCPND